MNLKRVENFESKADKKDRVSVLLTVVNEDSQQTIEMILSHILNRLLKNI